MKIYAGTRSPAAALLALLAVALAGCSGSGGDSSPGDSADTLSGVISAPGGHVAFSAPHWTEKLYSLLLGESARAAAPGTAAVAGATVELLYVDAAGADGEVVASALSDANGGYSITLPDGVQPGVDLRLRVQGASENLYARAIADSMDIDPVSHTADDIIKTHTAAAGNLAAVELDEAQIIQGEVESVVQELDDTDLSQTTVADMQAAIASAVARDDEASSVVNNVAADQSICGTVLDSNDQPVSGLLVMARDYGNWVTRAKAKTDASGHYCMNIGTGDYIVGALNRTDTSMAASGWWASTGVVDFQIDAAKVTVNASDQLTRDFNLKAGARISGTITAAQATGSYNLGDPLQGVLVTLRNFANYFPAASGKADVTGDYVINVAPGDYTVMARNKTRAPYGSGMYDGQSPTAGSNGRQLATKVTLAAGDSQSIDFALDSGFVIKGVVTDGASGPAVAGERVRVNGPSGPAARLRTDKEGRYRFWMQNLGVGEFYNVDSRGQITSVSQPASGLVATADFTATVGTVSGTLLDASANPVSQAKLFLMDTLGNFVDNAISNSDGSFTSSSSTAGNHVLQVRIDDGRSHGSIIYDGMMEVQLGTPIGVTLNSDNALGNLTLPAAGILQGTVTVGGAPQNNGRVQVRTNGTSSANVFVNAQILSDGSYSVSLPAGTYARLHYRSQDGSVTGVQDNVAITAGQVTTVDFAL